MEDKKELTAEEKKAGLLKASKTLGLRPGFAKALNEADFTDLEAYRSWKKRLKE